jgi:hypothetical protein
MLLVLLDLQAGHQLTKPKRQPELQACLACMVDTLSK